MSRQPTTDSPTNGSSVAGVESLLEQLQADNSEEPSSGSPHRRMSKDSEGYPSWLPKRPPPPAPASTFQSSVHEAGPSDQPFVGGRKPTPRSVRIVSLQDASFGEKDRREPTDQTRVGIPPPRVWSRGMGTPLSPNLFSSADSAQPRIPQPKFHSTGLHLELLQNPTLKFRLYFYLFPLFVFAHIPVQTFFDFNAVFMLIQISKFPNPDAPGVPGSGRNWALAAAAYGACWLVWIFPVFIVYELVYSFARRWRVKRPIILPLYLSSSAFNLVSMSSYINFCFMQHIRYSAFVGENGSLKNGLAETFWFYSQNLPTVALLLPRAGLCLALLLEFSSPEIGVVALADTGISRRDSTFFRPDDGTLTNYARGVLIANAAWTAWRAIVLLCSWIGLWVVSGSGCAGLCGPRHRWEEDDAEKTMSVYSDNVSDLDALPWSWREFTALRVQEAYEFCLTVRPSMRWSQQQRKKDVADAELLGPLSPEPFEGMEQVLAAVGFPSVPPLARRGVLSGDLFDSPDVPQTPEFADIIPRVSKRASKDREPGPSSPLMALPYPFTAPGAQMSSQDRVPFPPSPGHTEEKESSGTLEEDEDAEDEEEEEEEEGEEEDDDEEEEEEEEEEPVEGAGSEEPSSGRASGSMSSLGQPVTSRYPFQFRRPVRGQSSSSGAPSASNNTRSSKSRVSQATQSTGNRESSDSHSPRSQHTASSDQASLRHHSAGVIPMPPRHPQQGRSRTRAGTVPVPSGSSSPSSLPLDFPRAGRPRARTRMDSGVTDAFGSVEPVPQAEHEMAEFEQAIEPPESEGSHEAEREDRLGLLSLSAGPSPKSSFTALRHRRSSNLSHHRRGYSSSHSRHNSHSGSGSGSSSSRSRAASLSVSVRSRAQSLLQNIGAASHSSLELVQRLRANSSMARLEEDSDARTTNTNTNTHSRSGSGSDALQSSGENHTFGHPLRTQWHDAEQQQPQPVPEESESPARLQPSQSRTSVFSAPSTQQPSERTASRPPSVERLMVEPAGIPIIREGEDNNLSSASMSSSYPDISTAPQSFVTAAATIEGTTDSSGRTVSSWGGISHMVARSHDAAGTWRHGPA
ncbi:hypothetical protein B0H10DRAFT_1901553 [Mycena sp. CBHHK59/15]|nr:hypothetical protein B0H10DRAFT_1901553 [Mycena sp. CBHHK59/15]